MLSTLAASWWEPGTPNYLDIGDVSAVLVFLVTLTGAFYTVTRFWLKLLRKMIREEISEATAPIHPNANGGLSLADVARKTVQLENHLVEMQKENRETKDLLVKVLAQSVIIPDTPPIMEPAPKTKRTRKNPS